MPGSVPAADLPKSLERLTVRVERLERRRPDVGVPIRRPSGGATLYDAIIDSALTVAVPSAHEYPNLTSLLDGETWDDEYVFCVGVRFRPTLVATEPANSTPTIPGPILIEAIAKGGGTSATSGWTRGQPTTDPTRAPWEVNGSHFGTTGAVTLSGLQIYNTGTARGSLFDNSDVCFLNNCLVEAFAPGTSTRKLNDLTGGTTIGWHTLFSGVLFSGRVVCTDCHYEVLSTSGTVDLFSDDVYWDGGAWAGVNSGNATLRILDQFYIRLARVDSTMIDGAAGSAGGCTVDIRATSQGTLDLYDDGPGQCPNVIVRAGAGDVQLRGQYDDITVEAVSSANAMRKLDCSCENIADLSGPRLIGTVRTRTTAGRVICRGAGINLRCSGTLASTGTFLTLVSCTDSVIMAEAVGAGGTSAPFNIDAGSDRSIVIFAGSNTGFGAAGTLDGGSTSRVITEAAGS